MTLEELEAHVMIGERMQNEAIDKLDRRLQTPNSKAALIVAVMTGALAALEVLSGVVDPQYSVAILVAISAVSGFLGRPRPRSS
jgi:hypothetical protein